MLSLRSPLHQKTLIVSKLSIINPIRPPQVLTTDGTSPFPIWLQFDSNGLGQVYGGTTFAGREVRSFDPLQARFMTFLFWNVALTDKHLRLLADVYSLTDLE